MRTLKIAETREELYKMIVNKKGNSIEFEHSFRYVGSSPLRKCLDEGFYELSYECEIGLEAAIDLNKSDGWSKNAKTKSGFRPYQFIPLYPLAFLRAAAIAVKANPGAASFVDCGSGYGDKPYLFGRLYRDITPYGIEYNQKYVRAARNRHNFTTIHGDITTEDYSNYDIIYAYNPMNDVNGMEAYFRRVHETAKPSTICIFVNVATGGMALNKINKEKPLFEMTNESKHVFRIIK